MGLFLQPAPTGIFLMLCEPLHSTVFSLLAFWKLRGLAMGGYTAPLSTPPAFTQLSPPPSPTASTASFDSAPGLFCPLRASSGAASVLIQLPGPGYTSSIFWRTQIRLLAPPRWDASSPPRST